MRMKFILAAAAMSVMAASTFASEVSSKVGSSVSREAPTTPLPEQRDIPDEFSAVICENEAKTAQMLTFYTVKPAPKNFGTDTQTFFKGLKATGCKQKSNLPNATGDIAIDHVVRRITLQFKDGPNRFIQFTGRWSDGGIVNGIVDEDWNNRMPRTELAKWMESVGKDGSLDARQDISAGFTKHFYRCNSAAEARQAVKAIKRKKVGEADVNRKVADAARQAGCRQARDRYFVVAKFENTIIDCGHECYVDLTALEAIDSAGLRAGLIFDASLH